jgi:hypothetical protein
MHISLGHRKHGVKSVQGFEDALTSMFFGTLCYLHPRSVADFFQSLLGQQSETIRESLAAISRDDVIVKFEFWKNLAQTGRVEPDLLVRFLFPDGDFVQLLIECKWESGESSADQLLTQWKAVPREDRSKTFHVYLVKYRHEGERARQANINAGLASGDGIGWGCRLLLVTWHDVMEASAAHSASGGDAYQYAVLRQWKADMAGMFDRIGVWVFRGFAKIHETCETSQGVLFWKPFHGFEKIHESCETSQGVLFWKVFHGFEQFSSTEICLAPGALFYSAFIRTEVSHNQ